MRNAEFGIRNNVQGGRTTQRFTIPHFAFRTPNSKAFTLVELMVIIVVLGVMLSLIIPRLGELGEANLKRSARHLTGMIRFLRDESQAKKAVYRLRFDVQGGRYWAEVLTAAGDESAEFKRLSSEMASEGSLAGQTTFSDVKVASHPDDPYIQFTPDGCELNIRVVGVACNLDDP